MIVISALRRLSRVGAEDFVEDMIVGEYGGILTGIGEKLLCLHT
jgi:hypothetical protein